MSEADERGEQSCDDVKSAIGRHKHVLKANTPSLKCRRTTKSSTTFLYLASRRTSYARIVHIIKGNLSND